MSETWEQTKARLKRDHGISVEPEHKPEPPRYDTPPEPSREPRFNLRRTVLPGAKVDWLVSNATQAEINWWLDHKHRFKPIVSPIEGIPPVELFDVLPFDAPKEQRSPYFNTRPVVTKDE